MLYQNNEEKSIDKINDTTIFSVKVICQDENSNETYIYI